MAIVTGTLKDVGLESLYGHAAELHWIPSAATTMLDGTLISGMPKITPIAADDSWYQELVSSELCSPTIRYGLRVKILSLIPDLPPVWVDFPDWALWVPVEGGTLSSIADTPTAGTVVWEVAGDTIPALARPGDIMLDTTTSDLYRIG